MEAETDVVITSFNAGPLLEQCLDSLITSSGINEIHVSDNDSRDGTIEAVKALQANHSNIVLHDNRQNLGFAKACNLPLPYLKAPYVLFLNPDASVPANAIEKMLQFMEEHPDVGMAGPLIINADGTEQRGCRRHEPTPARAFSHFSLKQKNSVNQTGAPLPEKAVEVDAISGAFMLVRRTAIAEVGKMDEGYFLHCEDLDWCKRFHQAGWRVMFVPDVTINHVKGGSSKQRMVRVEWHKHKGMVRYYRKFYRDEYPLVMRLMIYSSVWARFLLLTPLWWAKSLQSRLARDAPQ